MEKMKYDEPEAEVIYFGGSDIINTSDGGDTETPEVSDPPLTGLF